MYDIDFLSMTSGVGTVAKYANGCDIEFAMSEVRTSIRFDSEAQKELWLEAARKENRTLSNWVKTVCNAAAQEQLGEQKGSEKKRRS